MTILDLTQETKRQAQPSTSCWSGVVNKLTIGKSYRKLLTTAAALSVGLAVTGSAFAYSTTSIFYGGEQGEGMDLQGNFELAESYGSSDFGASFTIQNAVFSRDASRLVNAYLLGGLVPPNFGSSANEVNTGDLANDWAEGDTGPTVSFEVPTVEGRAYKLQLFFHDSTSGGDRKQSVQIGSDTVESNLNVAGMGASGANPKGVVIGYYFTGTGSPLPVALNGVSGNGFVNAITLEALPATQVPYFSLSPKDVTNAVAGGDVTLTSLASGSSLPFAYQWFFKGAPLSSATNRDWVIPAVSSATVGAYTVTASNSGGSVSAIANVAIDPTVSLITASSADEMDLTGNFVLAEYYGGPRGPLVIGNVCFLPSTREGTTPTATYNHVPYFGPSAEQHNLGSFCELNAFATASVPISFSIETVANKTYKLQLFLHDNSFTAVGQRIFQISVDGRVFPCKIDLVSLGANVTNPKIAVFSCQIAGTGAPAQITLISVVENPALSALTLEDVTPGIVAAPSFPTPVVGAWCTLGNPAQLIVPVNGADLTFKWQKSSGGSWTDVQNSANVSGVTSNRLSIASVVASDLADYRIIATNSAGSITGLTFIKTYSNQPQALIGHWLSGVQNLADSAAYAASGTHDGQLIGASTVPTWSDDVPVYLSAPGISSLDLSAGGQGLSILNSSTYDANYLPTFDTVIANGCTVTLWAKGWLTTWSPFVSKNGEGAGFQIRRHANDGVACFTVRGTKGSNADGNGSISSDDGTTWHHYAATWDGVTGVRKLYVDNKLSDTQTGDFGPLTVASTSRLTLGARDNGNYAYGSYFAGKLFDVRVYGYALSTNEITVVNGMSIIVPTLAKAMPKRVGGVGEVFSLDGTAAFGGTALKYTWQKLVGDSWVNVVNSSVISGSTANLLNFSNLALTNAGTYQLIASNNLGAVSNSVILTVLPKNLNTLIGHWVSGPQSLTDSSGYSPAGTHDGFAVGSGSFVWSSDVPAGFDPASFSSLDLTGGNAAIAVANSSTNDAGYRATFDLNHSFSYAFWAKGCPDTWNPFISKQGESGGFQVRRFLNTSDNRVTFTIWGTPNDGNPASVAGIDQTTWHHYAAVWDATAGVRTLYIDTIPTSVTYNEGNSMFLSEINHLVLGGRENGSYGSFFSGKLFDVRAYGYAISAQEVVTSSGSQGAVLPATLVTGPAPGQGLDLQGNFVLAEYFGNPTGPVLNIGGVAFSPSTRAGGNPNLQNLFSFGPNSDQVNFGTLSAQNVWGDYLNFTIPNTAGVQYKLQLLFHENHFTTANARQFSVMIAGSNSVPLVDLVRSGAYVTNAADIVVSYLFTGDGNPLPVKLFNTIDKPTLSAFTLEDLSSADTLPVLLTPMAPQNTNAHSTVYLVANVSGANLTYRWQKEVGNGFQDLSNTTEITGVTTSVLCLSNVMESATYRVVVSNVAGSIQPTVTVTLPTLVTPIMSNSVANGQLSISWTTGVLQSTTALNGTNTVWVTESATSPFTLNLNQSRGNKFYRALNQ